MKEGPGDDLIPIQAYRPLYTRPKQRRRWQDHEGHASVPWNDVFFDLFYVAAAYNLANIIVNSPNGDGLLYFAGCFWAVHNMWIEETFYAAQYVAGDDVYHNSFHIAFYLVVASAILHIRQVDLMSVPSVYIDMFAFSLACLIANCFHIWRNVELLFWGEGEPAMKVSCKREICYKMVRTAFYLAATVISGTEHYGGTDEGSTNNTPISLLGIAALVEILIGFIYLRCFFPKDDEKRKLVSVPVDTDYLSHRYGEWTMLMLGESILSLLIVEVVSRGREYYVTFFTGIVTLCLLMYLYFYSGPTHAEEHALLRHVRRRYFVVVLMQFYSAGLVIVGASYKLFMYEYTYENYEEEFGRRLLMIYRQIRRSLKGLSDYSESDRRQQIAYFFCFSLAVVWLCSDIMMSMHKGLRYNWTRLRHEDVKKRRVSQVLLISRVGLLGFIATLWAYVTDPHYLAAIGMCCVFVQVVLRVIGSSVFPYEGPEGEQENSKESNMESGVDVIAEISEDKREHETEKE